MSRSVLSVAGAGAVLWSAACLAAAEEAGAKADLRAQVLRKEISARGWIVLAAHPSEVEAGKVIARKQDRGQLDLYLARPDGSKLRNITNTQDYHEYGGRFSPDGRKLLYRRLARGRKVNHDQWGMFGQLVIADADGSKPVVQGADGELPWASWSPDAKRVACLYRRQGVIRIHDLATKKTLKEMPRQGIFQQLFWSPDGRRLVGTANVRGRQWNILSVEIETGEATLLSRAFSCTPDWFQKDADRVIHSNRTPGMTPRLGARANRYGFTVLMQATADGRSRTLVYGRLWKHVYFGCMSPDDRYVIFSDDPQDGLLVGEMHLIRLADTPIVAPEPVFPELKQRYPNAKDGPVLDLKLPGGAPLRGFEPHWTYAEIAEGS
jgi:Tol biopolymer transport system component